MYKLHKNNKSNRVTIQDQFYTCVPPENRTRVIQPLARDHNKIEQNNTIPKN